MRTESTGTGTSRGWARLSERERDRWPVLEALALALAAAWLLRGPAAAWVDAPLVQTWSTLFVAVVVQALPFLALGVALAAAIAALLPEGAAARLLPRRSRSAVPAAAAAGMAMPGCECGSVPIAGRLVSEGAQRAAALTFALAAPAVNPVVMAATAVAFPGQPEVVAARFAASFATAVVVGLVWRKWGADWLTDGACHTSGHGGPRWPRFAAAFRRDAALAGGFLVVGAAVAASAQVFVPDEVFSLLQDNLWLAVLVMVALAVVLALCSEADAFVASSLPQVPLTARLVFLVVGPVCDVKLIALQAGVFGRRFVLRFVPLTLTVAVVTALAAAAVVL